MELEKEEEKKNISDEETDLELLQKFSKHKNNNSNNININKNDIFIKCSFDEKTIEQNKQLLSQYEKSGLIKTSHYFIINMLHIYKNISFNSFIKCNSRECFYKAYYFCITKYS